MSQLVELVRVCRCVACSEHLNAKPVALASVVGPGRVQSPAARPKGVSMSQKPSPSGWMLVIEDDSFLSIFSK
jgi:hypothetical protein